MHPISYSPSRLRCIPLKTVRLFFINGRFLEPFLIDFSSKFVEIEA